ncbi:MAG: NADH:ubiquinone reductase (Na(+)-transporting) subunit A, partial [Bacteroidota bacterium]
MSKIIKLKKGFDINLAGKADKKVVDPKQPETFAYKPSSFHGILRPKLMVQEGTNIKAGTPILFDKTKEKVMHVAPVSGEVVEIKRGPKRKLLEVVILADKEIQYEDFKKSSAADISSIGKEEVIERMLESGVWPNLVQRPYGIIANPDDNPKAIFISAFDSHPLAPDYDITSKGDDQYFQAGLSILKRLTSGDIQMNITR